MPHNIEIAKYFMQSEPEGCKNNEDSSLWVQVTITICQDDIRHERKAFQEVISLS